MSAKIQMAMAKALEMKAPQKQLSYRKAAA
jgi:hypothetical protein